MIKNGEIELVVNTVDETRTRDRRLALRSAPRRCAHRVTYYTTIAGARPRATA